MRIAMSLFGLRHSLLGRLAMHVKANIKIASRYLLPLEIYMAVIMISWGVSGGFVHGGLWNLINNSQAWDTILDSNTWWGFGLCSVGGLQFTASFTELATGRRWEPRLIYASVSMRCICAFLSTITWICVAYVIITIPEIRDGPQALVSMWIQVPVSIIFNAVAYGGNLRVRTVLNAKVETTDLETHIVRERRKLIPMFWRR